jgi:lysyl-tRNA synthetase class 1
MMGKDHQPNQGVYARIAKILGHEPPVNYVFELFLDDKGEKISKTKGNGIAVEDWLRYAPQESLALYQFQKPRTAKRLYFDVIPKAVDEYISFLDSYPEQNEAEQLENPVWHIHNGKPPPPERTGRFAPMTNSAAATSISFALLLNLVSAANAETKDHLWKFIGKYAPGATPASHPRLDQLCGYAIAYYDDFVKPAKKFRQPTEKERVAFNALAEELRAAPVGADAEALQNIVYEVGKKHGFEPLRDWFKALYEVLLGQEQGPRFGSFIAIFGIDESVRLIERGLKGALVTA